MKRLKRCLGLVLFCSWSLSAVTPTQPEMKSFNKWFRANFLAPDQVPPFSLVYDGKPSASFITGWKKTIDSRSLDPHRSLWTITYDEPNGPLRITLELLVYADLPAVDWLLRLSNRGLGRTAILTEINPLNLRWQPPNPSEWNVHHSMGEFNSAESFKPINQVVPANSTFYFHSKGGRSSDGCMPFFNMSCGSQGVISAIGWTGQWQATFANADDRELAQTAGMEWTYLSLNPSETIRAPRIVLLFWQGEDDLRGNNLFRQLLIQHYLPRRDGRLVFSPICGSIDVVEPNGSYEGPHVQVMPELAKRGFEVFWSDMDPQHWYPIGFPDGTGTWQPDPVKYPHGLAPIGEAAHRNGLGYLLWFEPERVALGSLIDRTHPEFLMVLPGEKNRLFKLQDSLARAWLIDHVDEQISAAQLDWLRWDFNIVPLPFWQSVDPPDRQGITEIRYIEGLYSMMDELLRRHPGMVIDVCASGGRRLDIEMVQRGLPLWHSDMQCAGPNPDAEQLQNGGLNRWLPMHGCGNFGYEPSYRFRSAMTAGNILVGSSTEWLSRQHHEKEEAYLQRLGLQCSPWYEVGPFTNPGGPVFAFAFPPQKHIKLDERFDHALAWKARPEWQDGEPHHFDQEVEGAYYLYRTLRATGPCTLTAYLASDDAIHCWLNDQLVFVRNIDRSVNHGMDSTRLPLRAGDNHLLLKITNKRGRSGFYFSTLARDPRTGKLDTAFPETEQSVKRSIALYKKIRPYLLGDFYPLFAHEVSGASWYGYQFHRPDQRDGVVVLFRRAQAEETCTVQLRGIHEGPLVLYSENEHQERAVTEPLITVSIHDAPGSEILFYRMQR